MPLYMDIHHLPEGADAEALAHAHQADLEIQGKYDTEYLHYWFDERSHTAFCLVHAPDADAAASVHREAHGLVAEEIYQVEAGA